MASNGNSKQCYYILIHVRSTKRKKTTFKNIPVTCNTQRLTIAKTWKSVKKSFIISCEQIEVLRLAVDDRRTVKLNADTEFIQGHVIVCQNYVIQY